MRTFLAAAMLLATSLYSPATGQGVGQCAPSKVVSNAIEEKRMHLASFGLISPQAIFAIYANQGGDNWVAIIIRADSMSCILAEGSHLGRMIIEPRGEKV